MDSLWGHLTISPAEGTQGGWMDDYDDRGHAPWSGRRFSKVIIEKGVTTIGDDAFLSCASSEPIYYGIGENAEPTLQYEESIPITDTTYICAVAHSSTMGLSAKRSVVVRVTYFADHTSSLTAHKAVAPTCTEAGREAYWECRQCQKLFSDAAATIKIAQPVVIEAQGHAYNQPVWSWTEDYQASVTASEATVWIEGVKIYPNPSRGEFKVELPIDAQVEIFDVSGKKVLALTRPAGTHGFSLTQAGIYVLKVSAGGQQATFRLVVR